MCRRALIGFALAAALAGCGSAAPSPPGSSAGAGTSTPSSTAATAARAASTPPASATSPAGTSARTSSTPTATAPPTSTTPQSLPEPKRRKGPRRLSVAETSRPIEVSGGRSAAQQLVEAWRGGPVAAGDRDVVLVQRHLSSLDGKCVEPAAAIAGFVRAGIERYRAHGVRESPVEFARALDSATPAGRSNCKGILRTLLAQVEQG